MFVAEGLFYGVWLLNAEQIRDHRYAECIKILRNALLFHSQV